MSASVAVALPHDLAAGLARGDVGVEGLVVVRVDAVADVRAELDEQNLATTVDIHLLPLLLCLLRAHLQAQLRQTSLELAHVDAAVTGDLVENLEQLVEPENVQQEIGKLALVHPIVALLTAHRRLLVRTHQRRLVVQPRRPMSATHHVDDHSVDLREADDVVAVHVEGLPHRLQRIGSAQAILVQLTLQRQSKLDEFVVGRERPSHVHILIGTPLTVCVAAHPRALGLSGVGTSILGIAITPGAVVHSLADHPTGFAGVEQIASLRRASHPNRPVVVHATSGLIRAVDELLMPALSPSELHRRGGRRHAARLTLAPEEGTRLGKGKG
mmetsp:Transcript_101046/g.325420  ORF Transcript_101046/g.325420 Transcript_101046/m.325420 type:complete len:328 (-) Transcript_101046:8-991(-)